MISDKCNCWTSLVEGWADTVEEFKTNDSASGLMRYIENAQVDFEESCEIPYLETCEKIYNKYKEARESYRSSNEWYNFYFLISELEKEQG